MFEKLKEYGLYIVLGLIALGSLAYAYISTSNQQKGAEVHEATLDAMVKNLSKSEKQKKNSTVADDLLVINGGKNIGQYQIDNTKVSYVIGETYEDIFNNKKTIDISSDLTDVSDGKLRIILIANPATQVNGEDINTVNLNSDHSLSIGSTTIGQENLKGTANELKGYNVSAIGYGPFANEKIAKEFRDTYFSSYEVYEIGDTGMYLLLTEYNTTGGETLGNKINSASDGTIGGAGGDNCNEYLCLDANGITIKALSTTVCGNTYEFNGDNYYVACNKSDLLTNIKNGTYDSNRIVTTKVTDMSRLFMSNILKSGGVAGSNDSDYAHSLRGYGSGYRLDYPSDHPNHINEFEFTGDISNWDTSNVTDMSYMFFGNSRFNGNISKWNTSNVTNMRFMFATTGYFNQPIGNWDVFNVTDMSYMFENALSFNQPIGNWNVSNVTDMTEMFAIGLEIGDRPVSYLVGGPENQDDMLFNQDIGNWNTESLTSMQQMFYGNYSFNQNISGWNVSNMIYHDFFDRDTSDSWTADKKPNFN